MAHPLKSDAASAHSAKLSRMTTHYGLASGPANNITTPQERLKGEEGEHHVGFGADSANATSKRGDKPARRSMAANPVPTYAKGGKVKHKYRDNGGSVDDDRQAASPSSMNDYVTVSGKKVPVYSYDQAKRASSKHAKGGKVKHRDGGGDVSAIEEANRDQAAAEKSTGGVIARARGGRMHGKGHKGATHVNVMIAPQGAGAGGPPMAPPPALAALAAGAHPPMGGPPPMAPPPGGPPPPPGSPPPPPPGGPPPPPPGGPLGGCPDGGS